MTGTFSIASITGNNNGNNNGKGASAEGFRIIEIDTPTYEVREQESGSMLLVTSRECLLNFSKVNQTSTFILYFIPSDLREPNVSFESNNKEIVGADNFSMRQMPLFITVHKGKIYTAPIS